MELWEGWEWGWGCGGFEWGIGRLGGWGKWVMLWEALVWGCGHLLAGLAVELSPFCYVTSGLINLGFYGLSLLLMRCHHTGC